MKKDDKSDDSTFIQNKYKQDTFIYKSHDMVNFMSPGGIWSSEIIDTKHIVFRRAQDAVDIRPGRKLNTVVCGLLFMNVFYDELLSYLLMFVIWCSMVCICAPEHYNGTYSWNSFCPQLLRMASYGKTCGVGIANTFVYYLRVVGEGCDDYLYCLVHGNNVTYVGSIYKDEDEESGEEKSGEEKSGEDESEEEESESGEDEESGEEEDEESGEEEEESIGSNSEHSSMPDLIDYGLSNQEEETNALHDTIHHFYMNNENFISWVKSGENGIISSEYFDEWESDENWLYALAEMCYSGDTSYDDIIRSFVYYNENLKEEEEEEEEQEEEEEEEEDWDTQIRTNEFIKPKKGGMWLRSMR